MIVGLGIDIVDVERFKEAVSRWGNRFVRKLFSDREIGDVKGDVGRLAGKFAVKESVYKATGGVVVRFKDVEVLHGRGGEPVLVLSERAKKNISEKFGDAVFHISISHEKRFAVGIVILEGV